MDSEGSNFSEAGELDAVRPRSGNTSLNAPKKKIGPSSGSCRVGLKCGENIENLEGESGDGAEHPTSMAQDEAADDQAVAADVFPEARSVQAKALPRPVMPTAAEVAEHEITHLPYRTWCAHCVRGRGISIQHRRVQTEAEQVPTISMDYGFLGDDSQRATSLPILIARDRMSKTIWALPVPNKGVHVDLRGCTSLIQRLENTGYTKMILKCDNEPAIVALQQRIAEELRRKGVSVIKENAPLECHEKSNGDVESAVKQVAGLSRTLKSHVEHKIKADVKATHPLLAWLIEHAANLLTLFLEGPDGLTAYHRLKGKPWRTALPAFGESVLYRSKPKNDSKLDARWQIGTFLGIKMQSTEKIVHDPASNRIHHVQTVKRRPETEAWSSTDANRVSILPWGVDSNGNPCEKNSKDLPKPICVRPERPDVPADDPEVHRPGGGHPRRIYITRSDMLAHGFTDGCPACEEVKNGVRQPGTKHSSKCRMRLEGCIRPRDARGSDEAEPSWHGPKRARLEPVDEQISAQTPASSDPPRLTQPGGEPSALKRPAEAADHGPVVKHRLTRKCNPFLISTGGQEPEGLVDGSTPPDAQMDVDFLVHEYVQETREITLRSILEIAASEHDEQPVCEELNPLDDWEEFYDDMSGKLLNPTLVREARAAELKFIDEIGVWDIVDRPAGEKVVGGRWVDVNKGDEERTNYRSRYVGKELKRGGASKQQIHEFFAAMPPMSSFMMLLVLATTDRVPDETGKMNSDHKGSVLSFLDIKRAHFMSPARRRLFVELPPELKKPDEDKVALLKRSLYGTRDASQNWEFEIARVFESLGFQQGRASPCLFFHAERRIRTTVHGDDFTSLGKPEDVAWLRNELQKVWLVEDKGILAPPGMTVCPNLGLEIKQNMRHLNRLIKWTSSGITTEADPRHAELLMRDVGVTGSKVTTPLAKPDRGSDIDEEPRLTCSQATWYRSNTMRLAYLSQDRPDLQRAVRELAKGMTEPTRSHEKMLKRAVRYVARQPRAVLLIKHQVMISRIHAYVDTDHAGCIKTRKSTTGGVIMLGNSKLRSFCKGQAVIALSSGEAEFYGLVSMVSEALGDQSILKDYGIRIPIDIHMDATAGAAIGARRGLGRVKHIDTAFLWVQDVVGKRLVHIRKVDTKDNVADILTKPVDWSTVERHMLTIGYCFTSGTAAEAYKI